jgi:transcriptional regulator with XRE-family HTH domain
LDLENHLPNPIAEADALDKEIGGRLRLARRARGMTQSDLARSLGVTFQQVQKYERGTNRVSSSALLLMSKALEVSPGELLGLGVSNSLTAGPGPAVDWDHLSAPGVYELLSSYSRIAAPKLRRLVLDLADELADEIE